MSDMKPAEVIADEVRRDMRALAVFHDPEMNHSMADDLLLKLIRAYGHDDIAKAFEALPKWYA